MSSPHERILEAIDDFQSGLNKLSRGPAKYYVNKVNDQINLLFDRFCPFKEGDRVVLTKTPLINEKVAPGWVHAKHFLVKGSIGTVTSRDADAKGFHFNVTFDNDTWIDASGTERPTERERAFGFREGSLAPYNGPQKKPQPKMAVERFNDVFGSD